MKLKLTLIICLSLFVNIIKINAQDIYETIFLTEKKTLVSIKNIEAIEIPISKDIVFLANENKYTYAYLYDENHNLKKQLKAKKKNRSFINIGYSVSDEAVRIVQKDRQGLKYSSVIYDFAADAYSENFYPINGKGFTYIQSFNKGENTYVYLVKNKSSILKVLTFDIDGRFKSNDIDLTNQFKSTFLDETTLYDMVNISESETMAKVDPDLPTLIEIASSTNKMYTSNDGFIWTFDGHKNYSFIMQFDTPDSEPTFRKIKQETFGIDNLSITTNSFLDNSNIYQIGSSSKKMGFAIKDFETLEILKTFEVNKEDEITFKNSPIIQSNDTSGNDDRVLEKTSKLLRKMSSSKNGISIYPYGDGYQVTIGGSRPIYSGGLDISPAGFPSFNGDINSGVILYSALKGKTGSVRIECLFDKEFNHIDKEIEDSTFDLIRDYSFESDNTSANNLFYIKGKLLFGIYYINDKKIIFYQFDI